MQNEYDLSFSESLFRGSCFFNIQKECLHVRYIDFYLMLFPFVGLESNSILIECYLKWHGFNFGRQQSITIKRVNMGCQYTGMSFVCCVDH